MTSLISAN